MNYLLISNAGVAPVEGYTLLGMSTTRHCGIEGTIGQFGSGTKHAINVLLRAGIKFYIYCGLTRLEFSTRDEEIDDGVDITTVKKVVCKLNGTSTKTIDCGWCLDFGSMDWKEVSMGLREFVSNAIDRTIRQAGCFQESLKVGSLKVVTVEEKQRRANSGNTQVYIELTPEVQQYFGELPKRFLHFSSDPSQVYQTILPKADRNLTERQTPMIYRCGVLVREMCESRNASLFDYNFNAKQITIDESRNSSEYYIRAACAKVMRSADQATLVILYESLCAQKTTFEADLDTTYLCSSWETPDDTEKQVWTDAWKQVSGETSVLCKTEEKTAAAFVARKGYQVKTIKQGRWVDTVEKFGVTTAKAILNESEQKGREMLPPTQDAQDAIDAVWGWLESVLITCKDKPKVGCYREPEDTSSTILGFWEEGSDTVHLREDIGLSVESVRQVTALEMVVYYLTGSVDNSRDVQQFLLSLAVEMAPEPVFA